MPDVIAGRFALVDLIATGGSGAVWRARDLRTGELCAAKLLRQRDSGDLLRFVREKGVQFDHPHLVTPYSWAAEDEHVVIASRLVAGGTLGTLLRERGALSPAVAADLLDQLLDGLDHIHRAGWVHRDVKPSNILLEATGNRWPHLGLSDFGIAVHPGDARLTQTGAVIGTDGYLAPEVLAGAAPAPARDLFAAGVVVLRVLGVLPEEMPPPQHDPLAAVLHALTDPDPGRRPADATAARAMLAHQRPASSPRTAVGVALDVVDRMPPPPTGPHPGDEPSSSLNNPTGPTDPVGPDADTGRLRGQPTRAWGRTRPARTGPGRPAPGRATTTSWRPGRLVSGAALLVTALVVVLLRPGSNVPSTEEATTSPPGLVVQEGQRCSWSQQGDTAGLGGGGSGTCRAVGRDYTWARR